MIEIAALRPKAYSYLTNDNHKNKKRKRHKKAQKGVSYIENFNMKIISIV